MRTYFWNILVSIDQFINTLLYGNPDETISSRAAKARNAGRWWGCIFCRLIDKLDPNHCDDTIEIDEK